MGNVTHCAAQSLGLERMKNRGLHTGVPTLDTSMICNLKVVFHKLTHSLNCLAAITYLRSLKLYLSISLNLSVTLPNQCIARSVDHCSYIRRGDEVLPWRPSKRCLGNGTKRIGNLSKIACFTARRDSPERVFEVVLTNSIL